MPDEPVRAWKYSYIRADTFRFRALVYNDYDDFGASEERAKCFCVDTFMRHPVPRPPGHPLSRAVGLGKGCGWYAMKKRPEVAVVNDIHGSWGYKYLLEVELYGKIIEHVRGYRAEYQRVLSVRPAYRTQGATQSVGTKLFNPTTGRDWQKNLALVYTLGLDLAYWDTTMPFDPLEMSAADVSARLGTEFILH